MKKKRPSLKFGRRRLKKSSLAIGLALFTALFCATQSSAVPLLQQKLLNLTLTNVTIEQALDAISRENSIVFNYSNDAIDVNKVISVRLENATLGQALGQIFAGSDVVYEEANNGIVITKVTPRQQPPAPSPPRTVKGVIKYPDGSPVVGATVMVVGTMDGITTGAEGTFTIDIRAGNANPRLQISFVGMETQEVNVGNRDFIEVVMTEDATTIEQVVVTGMTQMDRRLFTGATDRLLADEVMISGLPEISRALEGRSAGVTVQNISGTFGAAPKIRIRGATSIYGNSKPLWVVDGVIIEDVTEVSADDLGSGNVETLISSAISGLNSDDIESFQILKDGSATSIYGARAMAGVIVITTKRGKAGTMRINYSTELTMRMKPRYNEFNIMDSKEQMAVYKEMHEKGWLNFASLARASSSGVYGKMYELMSTYDPVSGQYSLIHDSRFATAYLRDAEQRNTDWFDLLFRNSVMQTHSISVSSGNEKVSNYSSMSFMEDPGWTKQSSVRRLTANMNVSYKILPTLTANVISSASYRKQRAPGTQSQDIDSVYGEVKRDFDINPYSYALNTSRALDPNTYYKRNYADFNINKELDNNYINLNVLDMRFQSEFKWKPVKNLELGVLGALKYQMTSQEHYIRDESNQAGSYRAMDDDVIRGNNSFLYKDPDYPYDLAISVLPEGGIYQRTDYKMLSYDFRATATWNQTIDRHIFNFFGGMETNSVNRDKSFFNGWGLQYTMGEIPFYVYQYFKQGLENGNNYYSLSTTRSRNAAFFGLLTYSYAGKYTFNGTIRYEGSNRLGRSRSARWLPTWNLSGAWNAHEEDFFDAVRPALSNLTFRLSYSLTADRGPSWVSNSLPVISSDAPFRPLDGTRETGLYVSNIENSELTYEKKHEFNAGLDIGFLNDRLSLTLEGYKRNNFDLIGLVYTQGMGGEISKYANVASMSSHGFELSLSTVNIKNRDFSWNTDLIFSKTKNKITDLKSNTNVISLVTGTGYAMEGYPVRALFSIPFVSLNEDGYPVHLNEEGKETSGRINFQNNDNTGYLVYEGPSDPTLTGSFGNLFRWKGLQLNAYITYSFGNKIRLDPVFSRSYSDLTAMPREFKNRWRLPGDERVTNIPVIVTARESYQNNELQYSYNAYNYSNVRVADGGFVRFKELSIAYDFPKKWIEGLKIHNLAVKFQVTNLCLIYADKKLNGQDPEFIRSGGVATPIPRQFTFTLRFGM